MLYEIGAVALVVAAVIMWLRVRPVVAQARRCNDQPIPDAGFEPASVVVYSNDQSSELATLLPQLLGQDYPERFEVIVVNEGDSSRVREVVGDLQLRHSNLYLTHTPDGARNLSRKKLAITLGVKAARHPVVVLVAAGASVDSSLWLRRMMQHFSPDCHTEVVLGYAAQALDEGHPWGCRTRSFDYVSSAINWLSPAVKGHPWRGTEYNLAYRRDLFFRNKGFSRHLNLCHGDDDIFVSEIANAANTMVELSHESMVTVMGSYTRAVATECDARRRFTARFIKRRPWMISAIGRWCYLVAPLLALAAAVITPFNGFVWAAAGVALLLWMAVALIWRGAMKTLNGRHLLLTLPFIAAGSPLRHAFRSLTWRLRRQKRYTWE